MTEGLLLIASALAFLVLAVQQRRFEKKVLALLGTGVRARRKTRHLSSHRCRIDQKRRTNQ